MDSQRWASAEEDVTEGDLGLGKVAQLDICTGTAVCSRAGDVASGGDMDTQEGMNIYLQTIHSLTHMSYITFV